MHNQNKYPKKKRQNQSNTAQVEVATPLVVRSHSTATITSNQQQSHRQFIQQQHRSLNEPPTNNLHHHHIQSHQRLDHPELAEQENIDQLSGISVTNTPLRVIGKSPTTTTRNKTNLSNTCGGGLSLSSARRAHLVSRGAEFIAHQTTSTNNTTNSSSTKFGLNNNTSTTGNNSYNNTNFNNSQQQTTTPLSISTNTGKRLSGSPNLQKTK